MIKHKEDMGALLKASKCSLEIMQKNQVHLHVSWQRQILQTCGKGQ
jgi:hypothetical protein